MQTLNLVYPEQSDIPYQSVVFPDGQPHIKIDTRFAQGMKKDQPIRILTRMEGPAGVLLALFAKNTLDYLEFDHIELHVTYLLAARMDRVMLEGEPFSLKVIAGLINQAGFKKVRIFDPHSEVSTALIDRSYPVTNHAFAADALQHYLTAHRAGNYCLVSPDAGALKKIHKLAMALQINEVVECIKDRDLKTGALSEFKTTVEDLSGKTCFVIDDICDGGGTFTGNARMLKEKNAEKVILVVSHGIFSKGTNLEFVDDIYTTDSYRRVEGVHCFSIGKYLN